MSSLLRSGKPSRYTPNPQSPLPALPLPPTPSQSVVPTIQEGQQYNPIRQMSPDGYIKPTFPPDFAFGEVNNYAQSGPNVIDFYVSSKHTYRRLYAFVAGNPIDNTKDAVILCVIRFWKDGSQVGSLPVEVGQQANSTFARSVVSVVTSQANPTANSLALQNMNPSAGNTNPVYLLPFSFYGAIDRVTLDIANVINSNGMRIFVALASNIDFV